ncbi:TetR family transcriptional regulator [Mycobacterium branderi]|uniref:TetR family transcriptional regulator n=2 Tax=Mycobacterium branderi TaxID=43348 RepID=A0A7I7W4E1_9MYCO|nr:TetR/AcrR family transcriptional regulator [Mycobacterium branderi]MCV7235695.1 TetR/AcrR family transcriptional regulator [Mycobacterium branderi]ORA37870.1 TetR family transcriptional regulator [Mycobacterium branderi]BBZ12426.1 TetR family transcriptional regulator [Mycobacterium branderi]
MNQPTDSRADSTRQQILNAAAHQFAQRPYHDVGLDDILAEAELTKGAMYFHFRSKHALALAIIEEQATVGTAVIRDLLARKLSGLETLVEFTYVIAVQDVGQDVARAGLHLLETVGRAEKFQARLLADWIEALARVVKRAIAEGDITDQCDPQDVGRLVVSLYLGMRHTGNLDDAEQFFLELEKMWALLLRGMVEQDRLEYFSQFVRRRTALAIRTATSSC